MITTIRIDLRIDCQERFCGNCEREDQYQYICNLFNVGCDKEGLSMIRCPQCHEAEKLASKEKENV
jgi:hypothetical protein